MLGAAMSAPLMPVAGAAAPSRTAFAVAVAHAQRFPVISVAGLAKHGKISPSEADAMIKRLALEGKVKLVGPSRSGGVRAASRILTNDPWGIARTTSDRQAAARIEKAKTQDRTASTKAHAKPRAGDVAPWLAHLHDLCRARGMTLSPRCFA